MNLKVRVNGSSQKNVTYSPLHGNLRTGEQCSPYMSVASAARRYGYAPNGLKGNRKMGWATQVKCGILGSNRCGNPLWKQRGAGRGKTPSYPRACSRATVVTKRESKGDCPTTEQ